MNNNDSKNQILEVLRSITDLELDQNSGAIYVSFNDDPPGITQSSKHAFYPGSFTRDLLEVIELHMKNESF